MEWMQAEAPGWPRVRALVHPECKDIPNPGARPAPSRANMPPYRVQSIGISQTSPSDAITVSSLMSLTTGISQLTRAQAANDPTIRITGTGFTSRTFGRVGQNTTNPEVRVTAYTSSTVIEFELDPEDYANAGTLSVGAAKINAGWQVSGSLALTIT